MYINCTYLTLNTYFYGLPLEINIGFCKNLPKITEQFISLKEKKNLYIHGIKWKTCLKIYIQLRERISFITLFSFLPNNDLQQISITQNKFSHTVIKCEWIIVIINLENQIHFGRKNLIIWTWSHIKVIKLHLWMCQSVVTTDNK